MVGAFDYYCNLVMISSADVITRNDSLRWEHSSPSKTDCREISVTPLLQSKDDERYEVVHQKS
jgi:hypothetical protein